MVKMGTECHIIGVLKEIREKIGKQPGDEVVVVIEEDLAERSISPHPLLLEAFAGNLPLGRAYDQLSYTRKKEINALLESAKKEETRQHRLQGILNMLREIS